MVFAPTQTHDRQLRSLSRPPVGNVCKVASVPGRMLALLWQSRQEGSSAVGASGSRQWRECGEDGVADGGQAWLRRRS